MVGLPGTGVVWGTGCGAAFGTVLAFVLSGGGSALREPGELVVVLGYGLVLGGLLGALVGLCLGLVAAVVVSVLAGGCPDAVARAATGVPLVVVAVAGWLVADGEGWVVVLAIPVTLVAVYPLWRATHGVAERIAARDADGTRREPERP